jgi:hypothetical protein
MPADERGTPPVNAARRFMLLSKFGGIAFCSGGTREQIGSGPAGHLANRFAPVAHGAQRVLPRGPPGSTRTRPVAHGTGR